MGRSRPKVRCSRTGQLLDACCCTACFASWAWSFTSPTADVLLSLTVSTASVAVDFADSRAAWAGSCVLRHGLELRTHRMQPAGQLFLLGLARSESSGWACPTSCFDLLVGLRG